MRMERALLGLIWLIAIANFMPTVVSRAQNITFQTEQLIFAVPEYLLGATMVIFACFAAYMFFRRVKSKELFPKLKFNIGAMN